MTKLRGHSIGFVLQSHFLISAFTAIESVMMPMLVDQKFLNTAMRARAHDFLAEMAPDTGEDNSAASIYSCVVIPPLVTPPRSAAIFKGPAFTARNFTFSSAACAIAVLSGAMLFHVQSNTVLQ